MSENFKCKIIIILTFIFSLLLFLLKVNVAIISIKIFISPDCSTYNKKFWVGEKHEILISKFPENSNEKIYLASKNNKVVIFKKSLLMKISGSECLQAYTNINKINSKICFNIYETPELIFREANPMRIETNTIKKLDLYIHDYPKLSIKFQSSNPEIIKIDDEGIVTAVRPGKSIVSASGLDGKKTDIVIISVSNDGLITGCFGTNIVQQSSYGNILVSYVLILFDISIISNLSRHATGLITGMFVTLFITTILFNV